ncbi:MAG: hypothetical protein M3O09_06485 [Acidobacteriota bacterium]|nr:hypothetical protein [Acidobacteriota bacterium]
MNYTIQAPSVDEQRQPQQAISSTRTEISRTEIRLPEAKPSTVSMPPSLAPKRAGYGMPCAKCKTYYASDLSTCPVCKDSVRLSPVVERAVSAAAIVEPAPDPEVVEQERDRFLREFQSQLLSSPLQTNAAATATCTRHENHFGSVETASVCQSCYENLQERVDVLEAVLHMDLKEAAEVIYDAVWSDPSDPSKTYLNAAQSLLGELRKRSGITNVFGSIGPLPD